jgi:hypothetical protein
MKRILFKPILILAIMGAIVQGLICILLLEQNYKNPDYLKQLDYVAFYTGGYIARYESLPQMYDLELEQQVQTAVTAPIKLINFYPLNHPPLLARILQITTTKDFLASYTRWIISQGFFLLASMYIWVRLARLSGVGKVETWLIGISGLFFYPAVISLLKGQDSTFLLFSVSLWVFGMLSGRDRVAGLGLALTAIRPQMTFFLVIPTLFVKKRTWWWFLLFGLCLFTYCFLLVGYQGIKDLLDLMLITSKGTTFGWEYMPSLTGILARSIPSLSAETLNVISYSCYILIIALLAFLLSRTKQLNFFHAGFGVILYMFFSPHIHSHDLILLWIPVTCATILLFQKKFLLNIGLVLPFIVSCLTIVNQYTGIYLFIYFLYFSLAVLLYFVQRHTSLSYLAT